jgi:hypothetical protein
MIGSFRKNTSVDVRLSGGKEKAISIFFQEWNRYDTQSHSWFADITTFGSESVVISDGRLGLVRSVQTKESGRSSERLDIEMIGAQRRGTVGGMEYSNRHIFVDKDLKLEAVCLNSSTCPQIDGFDRVFHHRSGYSRQWIGLSIVWSVQSEFPSCKAWVRDWQVKFWTVFYFPPASHVVGLSLAVLLRGGEGNIACLWSSWDLQTIIWDL